MRLKLSEVASIAEVIGALAIVISLVYVGIQVSDSTLAVRSATANDASAAMSAWYITTGNNPEASRVVLDGITNPEFLSREETAQFIYLIHGLFLEYQAAYYVSEQGTLDVEMRESLVNTLLGVRDQPGFLMYWDQRQDLFQPSFRAFVDDLIQNGSTNTNLQKLYQPRKSE